MIAHPGGTDPVIDRIETPVYGSLDPRGGDIRPGTDGASGLGLTLRRRTAARYRVT
ncbi:hypothetical protein AB0D71_23290 [Streptomyces avermitilis]|uniref:hypothetical protein n=1 Tax=Streptomyces avermitilis TaxID=33903 RepID=UPI00340AF18B